MVSTDESTELWRFPPIGSLLVHFLDLCRKQRDDFDDGYGDDVGDDDERLSHA